MSSIPDIRDKPSYLEAVELLQQQWPSNPFTPSPLRAQVSGIDCLAILYRYIHASLPRRHWPPVEPEGSANQAILRYFWANLGAMEDDDGPVRDQLRQAALAQIQSTMGVEDTDFASLCRSPAMLRLVWARDALLFYRTPWSRPKGDETWVERTDLHTPEDLAVHGCLEWFPKTHPVLQDFVDQMKTMVVDTTIDGPEAEVKYTINEPLFIRVMFIVGEGVLMSLSDVQRFTALTMRPGDNAPPIAGTPNVHAYDTAHTHGYVLAAAVQARSSTSGADHDTIRLFGEEGREIVPTNTHVEQWRGSVKDVLPEGQAFLLLYKRVSESAAHSLRHAVRGPAPPSLFGLVQRKLDEDKDWWKDVSDSEPESYSTA